RRLQRKFPPVRRSLLPTSEPQLISFPERFAPVGCYYKERRDAQQPSPDEVRANNSLHRTAPALSACHARCNPANMHHCAAECNRLTCSGVRVYRQPSCHAEATALPVNSTVRQLKTVT